MPDRVLVVDDEEVVLSAVRKALRHDDLEIDAVLSAADALSLLATRPYALVITDLMMPGMDGLDLLRRIREMSLQLPAIMITGYPTIQSALRARRQGAFEYVTKPFTRQELRSVVMRALRTPVANTGPAPPATTLEPVWYIPDHAWARIGPDGTARVGVAGGFANAVGEIEGIQLPAEGELLEQGRACAVIRASDSVEHSLYCPLSGRVLEVNRAVADRPSLVQSHPEEAGWLFRLAPLDPDSEIPNLAGG